jgi:hypothetical protein
MRPNVWPLLVVTLASVGAGGQVRSGDSSSSGTSAIQGRVLAANSDAALRNARVTLTTDTGSGSTGITPVYTDGDGRFVFTGVPDGRFRARIVKAGFATSDFGAFESERPTTITVSHARVELGVTHMQKGAAITGRVVDETGDSIAAATVFVFHATDDERSPRAPMRHLDTDDRGEYRIGDLEPGAYVVSAGGVGADSRWETSFYPGVASIAEASPVALRAGDERGGIDFVLAPEANAVGGANVTRPPATARSAGPGGTAVIRGHVWRADGRPIARAAVQLVGATNRLSRAQTTQRDGTFVFEALPGDSYRLSARKPGFIPIEFGQRRPVERGQRLPLAEGEQLDKVDLVLPATSAIAGAIVDEYGEPLEDVSVRLLQIVFGADRRIAIDVAGARASASNDLGRFRVFGIPPGQYLVLAGAGPRPGDGVPGYTGSFFPSAASIVDAQLVTVDLSQETAGITIGLVRGSNLRVAGTAVGADGRPLVGSVLLGPSLRSNAIATEPRFAPVGADGRFEIRDVTPGEYALQAIGRRPPQAPPGNMPEGEFAAQYVRVAGEDVTNLAVRTSTGSTVRGRVIVDGSTERLKPEQIRLVAFPTDYDLSGTGGGPPASTQPKDDGTFELAGLAGPRRLLATGPPAWSVKSIRVSGLDVTDTPMPFGAKDQSLEDVEITVTDRGAQVSGRASDPAGRAINDYTVIVYAVDQTRWFRNSRFMRFTRSETNGAFEILGLPPGEYFAAAVDAMQGTEGFGEWQDPAFLDSLTSRATRVTLNDAQHLSLTLRVIVR